MESSSFAITDPSFFDFQRHFSEQEIAEALRKDSGNSPVSPFTTTMLGSGFDFGALFGDAGEEGVVKNEEDLPVPSIEGVETSPTQSANADVGGSQEDKMLQPVVTPRSVQNNHMPPVTSAEEQAAMGLKHESTDPLLYSMDDFDLFSNSDTTMQGFDSSLSVPSDRLPLLASPFQFPSQTQMDTISDLPMPMPNNRQNTFSHQGSTQDRKHLAPQQFNTGRRRSQTAPPEFGHGMMAPGFRRQTNGGPPGRPMPPSHVTHQSFPQHHPSMENMRPRRPDPRFHPGMMTRPYPITPPRHANIMLQHDNFLPTRPQSLEPGMRQNVSSQMRSEVSPDRGRRIKRQKPNHERLAVLQDNGAVDFAAWGMDQTLGVVECLLRDAVDKVRYGKDEEIERYVIPMASVCILWVEVNFRI